MLVSGEHKNPRTTQPISGFSALPGGSQTCPQHPKFHDVGLLRATPSIHQFSNVLFPAMSTDFCYPLEGSMRLEMNCTRAISFTPTVTLKRNIVTWPTL